MTFAEKLQAARAKRGLSIEQIAVITGYSYASISNFITGRTIPPARAQQPMLDALKSFGRTK